jgi:hypothetical protein
VCDHPSLSVAIVVTGLQCLLNHRNHAILIKVTLPKVSILPTMHFEVAVAFFRQGINPGGLKTR